MKKIFFICFVAFMSCAKPVLNVQYVATNTIEGYDHLSRVIVYCDGVEIARSSEQIQSKRNAVKGIKIPKGRHTIKCVVEAFDKPSGKWEPRTAANGYSADWLHEETVELKKAETWTLDYDIESTNVKFEKSN